MKKRIVLLLIVSLISITGCAEKETSNTKIEVSEIDSEEEATAEKEQLTEEKETIDEEQTLENVSKETEETEDEPENVQTNENLSKELFKELKDLEFYFSSGAGAWRTVLYINEDGTFNGEFSDGEMGSVGEEYPNGTCYLSYFDGELGVPVKKNAYTYSVPVKGITYREQPGVEEIIDGVLYHYSTAYGIDNTTELLIYTPGVPIEELPQGYRDWIWMALENPDAAELPFYGIYNEKEETGFFSYKVRKKFDSLMDDTKYWSDFLKTSLTNEEMNQLELNEKSKELYQTWDDALNVIWKELKCIMPKADFDKLLEEQRLWIKEKEDAINKAAAEVAGGSMEPMVRNLTAAEYTEKRVYELMEIYKQQ